MPFFRKRRAETFLRTFRPTDDTTILDVGGFHWFWKEIDCPARITCLNVDIPVDGPDGSRFVYVKGDGRKLPYADNAFDIVFSNSVIEHVGAYEDQVRFALEARRVGKRYWVQTPNRRFFIEPHFLSPFIHYLPKAWQTKLVRRFTPWGWATRPTAMQAEDYVRSIRLLTLAEMKKLFPDAEIMKDRFLCMAKSFVALR
jgi:hypothetical protein